MTCPREPAYVVGLLEQLVERTDLTDVRVRLVVDGCESDAAFLGPWAKDVRLVKDFLMPPPPVEPVGHQTRILRTFRRCLMRSPNALPLITLQDDARVAPQWLERALAAEERVRAKTDAAFFLTLWSQAKRFDGETFVLPGDFSGNVGLLLPARIHAPLASYLDTVDPNTPDDMALRAFAERSGTMIYDVCPHVVQHVGDHSSRHDRVMQFRSPTFKE